MYPAVEHAPRYEMNRFDRMNASLQNGGYAYDHSAAQSWNPNAFGGGQTFNSFGTTGRLKPVSRQRSAIPNVWSLPSAFTHVV